MATIQVRGYYLANTDPQQRCYNGAYAKSEWRWTSWSDHESHMPVEFVDERLAGWCRMNAACVKERGKSALCEYRIKEESEEDQKKIASCWRKPTEKETMKWRERNGIDEI